MYIYRCHIIFPKMTQTCLGVVGQDRTLTGKKTIIKKQEERKINTELNKGISKVKLNQLK